MPADLHCHTTHSDGILTPEEIVQLAKEQKLTGLAITDHDSISAYPLAAAVAGDLQLLTGVELSTRLDRKEVHILGYAFRPNHPVLLELTEECRRRREGRNREILARLNEKGLHITEEDIHAIGIATTAWGRVHIAAALMRKQYVLSIQEAFHRYIGENKSCYVPGEKFTVEEGIEAIHQAGGKAVIAHPHLLQSSWAAEQLLKMPFDGIEVHYGLFKPSVNKQWQDASTSKGWFATGGSDFHGEAVRPGVNLGCALCPESTFQMLWEHMQAQL